MTIGRDCCLHHHLEAGIDLGKSLDTICILKGLDKISYNMFGLVLMQNSRGKSLANSPKNLDFCLHLFDIKLDFVSP